MIMGLSKDRCFMLLNERQESVDVVLRCKGHVRIVLQVTDLLRELCAEMVRGYFSDNLLAISVILAVALEDRLRRLRLLAVGAIFCIGMKALLLVIGGRRRLDDVGWAWLGGVGRVESG